MTEKLTALVIGTDAQGGPWVLCKSGEFFFWCPSGPVAEIHAHEFPDRETAEQFLAEHTPIIAVHHAPEPGPVTNFRIEEI
jgi:hypothetical protein